ncbi:VOC family protein [Nocardioides renjunii]|uniref:VOC family protein n=1 Tax=Nocardioides renjunii TaxID=3095075 RepID=UPI002AFF4878|nr:VOC family protein [Nocardioides sp. S-34]WQQ20666.1 VOC family protein [Nocardioides sp. S-34]
MSNHSIVIPVDDLATATAFYTTAFGVEPHTDTPYYVGFSVGGQEIGLNPQGAADQMTGPVVYWDTDDLAAKVAEVEAAGGTVVRPVSEVGGGTSLALLTDPAGNQVGFISQG